MLLWLAGPAHALPCRWPRIAAHVGRGLAEAENHRESAESHFRAALALHDEVDLPLERVETLLQWGSFLRRAGRVADARTVLRQALTLTDVSGARWLGRYVAEELAVAGGRRSRGAAPDALTPQEQRVAALAATGRSAREIARQLSLSVRTVKTHLHRVYAKLGIHSQRELMARMPLARKLRKPADALRGGRTYGRTVRERSGGVPVSSRLPGSGPPSRHPGGIRRPAAREPKRHVPPVAMPPPGAELFSVDWEIPFPARQDG